jgi:hypothetical protein
MPDFMIKPFFRELTLTRLEARIGLADDVGAAAAAHDLTVGVAGFERLDGRCYFHFSNGLKRRKKGGGRIAVNRFVNKSG